MCHRIVAAFTILQTSVRLLYPQTMLLYFILHRLDLADLFVYGFPNCRRAAYICPCSDANSSDANRLISMNCRWSSALFYVPYVTGFSVLQLKLLIYMPWADAPVFLKRTGWFLWLTSVTRGKLLRCVIPMFHVSRLHNRREARFWWSYCPLLLTFVCGWTTGAAPCSSWLVRKLIYWRYQHTHTLIHIYENTVFSYLYNVSRGKTTGIRP